MPLHEEMHLKPEELRLASVQKCTLGMKRCLAAAEILVPAEKHLKSE
jgi:hypothetical protein